MKPAQHRGDFLFDHQGQRFAAKAAGAGFHGARGDAIRKRQLTMVATCRQRVRPLLDFLVFAGEVALRGSPPPSLLPVLPRT